MKQKYAKQILEESRKNYNLIADDFSRTRHGLWPELNFLRGYIKDGERILDLGCGNGRIAELFKDKNVEYIGVDNSEKLIDLAKKTYESNKVKFVVADGLNLPFPDNYFDKVFSIAVLHHIPSRELRDKFLKETHRVLKKEGMAVFTVWNLWQRQMILLHIKHFFFRVCPVIRRGIRSYDRMDFKDVFISWSYKANRYFHSFTKRELKKLFIKTGFNVEKVGLLFRKNKGWNYFIIAKKL